jgi:hypothetical protein
MYLFVANDYQQGCDDEDDKHMTIDNLRVPLQTPRDDRSSRFPLLSLDN